MDLSTYLNGEEEAVQTADTRSNGSWFRTGTLACTPERIVHIDRKRIIDIKRERVDAIEFHGPKYPTAFIYAIGFFLALFIAFSALAAPVSGALSTELGRAFSRYGVISLVIGLVVGGVGFLFRQSTVRIYTGGASFEFAGRDSSLPEFPSIVRSLD